jgi:ketosteroid isomerase-like protein
MLVRTPQETLQHHAEALGAEDLDGIVADYSDDVFFMTLSGIPRGKAGIRQARVSPSLIRD